MTNHLIQKIIWKVLKQIIVIFASFLFLWISLGNYEMFLNNLKNTGIPVDEILQSDQVSRYELTRLLNAVNCEDCVNAPAWMIEKYTNSWWLDFSSLPGKDFGDIVYQASYYNWKPYYYCVAYVWDNTWMRWYPSGVSPICDGKFCGNRNTTIWEFLQVVLNIADQYVYNRYLTDWSKIKEWMDGLKKWSYPDEYLNQNDKAIINKYAQEWLSGILPDEESLQPYIKYCMFNISRCGMQNFGEIKQWYRPIWELNILYDHNIVEYEKFKNGQIHDLVGWKYVLDTLYNLFKLVDCSFDLDYDCDGIPNHLDNCPNHYNPSQTDTSGDGIGDVCSDDITWDGKKNPIGMVDDLGNVVLSKIPKWVNPCVYLNCDKLDNNLWMYIKIRQLNKTAPVTVEFEAVTEGVVKWEITWDFGDGNYSVWKKVTNTFLNDGLYKIQANALWVNNDAHAITTILVWKDISQNYWLQISVDKTLWKLPTQVEFKSDSRWDFDKFEWNFGDGNVVERFDNNTIKKIFKTQNTYMITLKGYKNWEIVAVANTIVWAWAQEFWSNLYTNNLLPKKWQTISLGTNISGFTKNDIEFVERNWGGGNIVQNKSLTSQNIYKSAGTRVIIQKINLSDGREIQNFLTISVRDDALENSYAIETVIDKLVFDVFNYTKFKINSIWFLPESLLLLNRYTNLFSEKIYNDLSIYPKYFEYQYTQDWIFFPKTSLFIDECISLDNVATIAVSKKDICLDAHINWTLGQFKCDMDGDGVPDICDDDIDGDGNLNLVWLIKYEMPDCSISLENINIDVLMLHNNTCGLDNCPFFANTNQMDINNNGRWDECNSMFQWISNYIKDYNDTQKIIDSDGDGIPDHLDACPLIPENYNGIEDFDGCPEIWANLECSVWNLDHNNYNLSLNDIENGKIIQPQCLACPCSFSDFANTLTTTDQVKAILWDVDMSVLYSESIPESIKKFLK